MFDSESFDFEPIPKITLRLYIHSTCHETEAFDRHLMTLLTGIYQSVFLHPSLGQRLAFQLVDVNSNDKSMKFDSAIDPIVGLSRPDSVIGSKPRPVQYVYGSSVEGMSVFVSPSTDNADNATWSPWLVGDVSPRLVWIIGGDVETDVLDIHQRWNALRTVVGKNDIQRQPWKVIEQFIKDVILEGGTTSEQWLFGPELTALVDGLANAAG